MVCPRHCCWILIALLIGCQSVHHQAAVTPATHPANPAKPMIDFSRGAAGFPVAGKLKLDSSDHLAKELTAGYAAKIKLPTSRPTVTVEGTFPNLESLRIDLTGGTVFKDYRPTSLKSVSKISPIAQVKYLEYSAEPLYFGNATQSLHLTASNVQLGLLTGEGERATLVMTDASDGAARFDIPLKDLRNVIVLGAKQNAGKAAFLVTDTNVDLASDNPHSLSVTMRVSGFWLLLPATFTLTGRIDIDKDFNATTSGLSCKGNDVGGALLAGFIDSALKKYNGKSSPLASFPGDKLKLHEIGIKVDDSLHVSAKFGDESLK